MATASIVSPKSLKCQLSEWGLPPLIVAWFKKRGISCLFEWQVECLCQADVLYGGNLVYSAPTSAGKTLVADFLLLKRVLEYGKKALVIEPFVALTREKATTLKSMLFTTKARVGAFGGTYYTPGGLTAVSVAVCTIEKANNFINKLINENKLGEIGLIIVDEIHYIGDERRGHQLELLLTKVLFYNGKQDSNKRIQIVGLSATIPNLKTIASWLNASLYVTEYRPVPLVEKIKVGDKIYDVKKYLKNANCQPVETIVPSKYNTTKDHDDLFYLCIETIVEGHSTLVFCESKRECELMAIGLAEQIKICGNNLESDNPSHVNISQKLRANLSAVKIAEVLSKLKRCPAGPDSDLVKALRFGCGFHHAGLTSEEREIVEDGFKSGSIKTLFATSTLSSGVNLPARKVIIKSPMMISSNSGSFQREMLNPITYRQMIGRAGRKNIDTCGESVLICKPENQDIAIQLIKASLGDISSSLAYRLMADEGEPSGLKKAVLEVIANSTATNRNSIYKYLQSTFWLSSECNDESEKFKKAIRDTLLFLKSKKFIEELKPAEYKATRLGNAVLASGLHPDESLELLQDLLIARQGFCLLNDLHIIYQVTPNDIARAVDIKSWDHYAKIWHNLDDTCRYVGERVGIDEIVIARRASGFSCPMSEEKERVYKRYWVALVINDLISELQLYEICRKYRMSKATVQQAQRAVAQFAGVMSIFCNELGYANIAALVTPLETRINFSCQRDLLELIKLNITRPIARCLHDAGYRNTIAVAKGDKLDIEFIIRQLQPFKREQSFSEKDSPSMWVPELAKTMTTLDYASHIVDTAITYVEMEYDIDLKPILTSDKRADDSQHQESVITTTAEDFLEPSPSPAKRGRIENGDEKSIQILKVGGSDNIEEDTMVRDKDIPNFVVQYVGHASRDIDKFINEWTSHYNISLNFKLEQQVNEPIGGRIRRRIQSKRRRRSTELTSSPDLGSYSGNAAHSDDDLSTQDSSQHDGLTLRLDIDSKKYVVTKMYVCFDDDLTVFIVDNQKALKQIRDKLPKLLEDHQQSSSSTGHAHRRPIKFYTQSIVMTYKVLYAAFGLDQYNLAKQFEWYSFDVAWWMINNCPNRGFNNCNSSLSLVANTKWAMKYHHFLHPSSPTKKRRKRPNLVPPLDEYELGRSNDDYIRLKDIVKSGKTAILQPLINELTDELDRRRQINAYYNAEIPSRITMSQTMINGIGLDMKAMKSELSLYENVLQQLAENARQYDPTIALTNIRHVARVLYDILDLKKHLLNHSTKSDISRDPTNSEILTILSEYHPFPKLVQDYRKVGKALEALQSINTYARFNNELNMVRVFGQCDFWQLTGRVAMHDPDLFLINRNFTLTIPEYGKQKAEVVECNPRSCFIPVPGWTFLAADYSQLELRLLAHFSNDEHLLEILNRSLDSNKTFDVFRTVASKICRKPVEEISNEDRQHAKQICYGIIYGMGNKSLANQLNVNIEEAEIFRQDFFNAFPKINEFTQDLIEECSRTGYVESLLGRRRTIDGLTSEHSSAKSRGQRVAINTRIQSSASDIIKLAMKLVHDKVLDGYMHDVRLVLEMHDELIYEVNPSILDEFAHVLKSTMESLSAQESLRVRLLVNLKNGPNWSSLKSYQLREDHTITND